MSPSADMRRNLALWVWYRGTRFNGFQSQPNGASLQQAFEEKLRGAGVTSRVWPAGRTDRGVHARMQVLSVRAPASVTFEALEDLRSGDDFAVHRAVAAPDGFHAQFSATGKEYRYRIALADVAPGWSPYCWDLRAEPRLEGGRLDLSLFDACLQSYVGEHDFIAFHEKASPRRPRTIESISLREHHGRLDVRLRGSSFARYMVRYLVGSAALVAAGRLPREMLARALHDGVAIEGLRAAGNGLTLWEVHYPAPLDPFAGAGQPSFDAPPFVD